MSHGLNVVIGIVIVSTVAIAAVTEYIDRSGEKKKKVLAEQNGVEWRDSKGVYVRYVKRPLDTVLSVWAGIALSPIIAIIAILVKKKLGSPVIFTQLRPGTIDPITGQESNFKLYKFRTMTDERGADGKLLPDEVRLTKFGAWLRSTSLDELPELWNIIKGDMAIIGPRPQLVRDMVFMTDEQRRRHTVRPGLSGLAQIRGRNAISWKEKLDTDLEYIENISFLNDAGIIFSTIGKVFKKEGINEEGQATALDYGDQLLKEGAVSNELYNQKQEEAKELLSGRIEKRVHGLVSIIMPSYNTSEYIGDTIQSVLNQTYANWELIIVDDCSTDDTNEVLALYTDPRIRIYRNETNSGAAISRNKALREAKGQWIAHLDSDDLWTPDKLEKQIKFMEDNEYGFSYTNYKEIDLKGEKTGVCVTGPKRITRAGMNNYCWPGCLTVMYDAEKIGTIQIADIKKNNDYAMWLKISKSEDCYLLDEYLAFYRRGRVGSISSHSFLKLIGWHYKLFRIAENQNVLHSIISTSRNLFFGVMKKEKFVIENHK